MAHRFKPGAIQPAVAVRSRPLRASLAAAFRLVTRSRLDGRRLDLDQWRHADPQRPRGWEPRRRFCANRLSARLSARDDGVWRPAARAVLIPARPVADSGRWV